MDIKLLKKLRENTGAGMLDCKKALEESGDNYDKAVEILQKKAKATARKKATRKTAQGIITSYIHFDGRLGVILEINCESDFVANTPDFKEFANNIALHIAGMNPLYVSNDEISQTVVDKQKEILLAQMDENPVNAKKPANIKEKIITGKLNKWFEDVCLLNQKYLKDSDKTVKDYLEDTIGTIKENIRIKRFTRYELGEE